MKYIDYLITQTGKDLIGDKCVIEHLDNLVSRFVFDLDGTIPGRLYFAMSNPVTNKHSFFPLSNNSVVIGTSVSHYIGRWVGLLIGVADDYELTNDIGDIGDLDETKITYVSKEFKKIIVRKNFLNGEASRITYPAIDCALDSFMEARDRLEEMSILAAEDADKCEDILETVSKYNEDAETLVNEATSYIKESISNITSVQNNVLENAAIVSDDVGQVRTLLSQAVELVTSCNDILISCNSALNEIRQIRDQINNS